MSVGTYQEEVEKLLVTARCYALLSLLSVGDNGSKAGVGSERVKADCFGLRSILQLL